MMTSLARLPSAPLECTSKVPPSIVTGPVEKCSCCLNKMGIADAVFGEAIAARELDENVCRNWTSSRP